MKKFFILLLLLLSTKSIYADCAASGLWVFPYGTTVKQNSIFIITGYALSQDVIQELDTKHQVYLQSGSQRVNLQVMEILVGEFQITQAVLKPETDLEPLLEYTLFIEDLPRYEKLTRYDYQAMKHEPITYKVIAGHDTQKPMVQNQPKEIKKTLIYYGCGPDEFVIFDNPAQDSSEMVVKTTLRDLRTKKETTYYLDPVKGQIKVGHNMCSGAFLFDEKSLDYEVVFSFMDASGNLTPGNGTPISFTKPTEITDDDWFLSED